MVFYPAVIYSFLVFAFTLACALGVLNTAAAVFQSPPYNMSPGIHGLINIPLTLGIVIGSYCGGALTDRFLEWRLKKNNGIFEPETRLIPVILPFFIVPAGVLMYPTLGPLSFPAHCRYGFGAANLSPWILPFIGTSLLGFGLGSLPSATINYGKILYR